MISRRHLTALRKMMRLHNVQPKTQVALIDGVKGGLFRLEIKDKNVFLYLNNRRLEFRGTGLVSVNQSTDRRI